MLFSLSPLGDISRLRKAQIHGKVLFLLEGCSVECDGLILAARSPVLEQQLLDDYEVILDNYPPGGALDHLRQCMDLLYGGRVSLNSSNVMFLLRFSVQFEIDDLLETCCVWMEENSLSQELRILEEPSTLRRLRLLDHIQYRLQPEQVPSAIISKSPTHCKMGVIEGIPFSDSVDSTKLHKPKIQSNLDPNFSCKVRSDFGKPPKGSEHPCEVEERWSKDPSVLLETSRVEERWAKDSLTHSLIEETPVLKENITQQSPAQQTRLTDETEQVTRSKVVFGLKSLDDLKNVPSCLRIEENCHSNASYVLNFKANMVTNVTDFEISSVHQKDIISDEILDSLVPVVGKLRCDNISEVSKYVSKTYSRHYGHDDRAIKQLKEPKPLTLVFPEISGT